MRPKRTVAMTIYDRTPEIIDAVFAGLSFRGNRPDCVAVCYDRASNDSVEAFRRGCRSIGAMLKEAFLYDDVEGPRCPSRAWNAALTLVRDKNVFSMSSDVILAPHSVDMAFHMAELRDNLMVVGRADHCGPSYAWPNPERNNVLKWRTITWSAAPRGLGFCWLFPMELYRKVGGHDEVYMDGYCYEDDDLVLRMWEEGATFLFCDDIFGIHVEHPRDHLLNKDGKVTVNEEIFRSRYGDINRLSDWKIDCNVARCDVGITIVSHEKEMELPRMAVAQQALYGQDAPWRAIPATVHDRR